MPQPIAKGWSEDARGYWVYQFPWEGEPAAVIYNATMSFTDGSKKHMWVWAIREGVGRNEQRGDCSELLAAFEAVNEILGETEVPIPTLATSTATTFSKPMASLDTLSKPCGCKRGGCKKKPD